MACKHQGAKIRVIVTQKKKKQSGLFSFQVTNHAAVENSVELSSNGESSYIFERERVYAKINETQASLTTVLASAQC